MENYRQWAWLQGQPKAKSRPPILLALRPAHLLPLASQNALLVVVERACRHATLASPPLFSTPRPLYLSLSPPLPSLSSSALPPPTNHRHQQKPAISVSPPPANQIAQPLCGPQEPAVTCRGESQLHLRRKIKIKTPANAHRHRVYSGSCVK